MSIEKKKELKYNAWKNLNMCCETLCDKEEVKKYIIYLENKIKMLDEKINEK